MAKRKAAAAPKKGAKKPRAQAPASTLLLEPEIAALSAAVLDKSTYNSIVPLLAQYDEIERVLSEREDTQVEAVARVTTVHLLKIFQKALLDRVMDTQKDDKKQLVGKWVLDKYARFKAHMCALVQRRLAFELSLQLDALDVMLALIRLEAAAGEFPLATYQQLVALVLRSECGAVLSNQATDNFVVLEFLASFSAHWDLQAYFFEQPLVAQLEAWLLLGADARLRVFANYVTLIQDGLLYTADTDALKQQPTWVECALPASAYKFNFRTRYQKCLLALMKCASLSVEQYKALLLILHKRILPYMGVAAGLMDFLTNAVDQEEDEVVQILALNSLWELMKSYNVEYPDFYTKLYSLLTPNLLYTRYRLRFFRLCDLFLSLTHLAANLVASFIKRLARLALTASAPGAVIVIPFIYNLLKRHPTCMVLLQNADGVAGADSFDEAETDPYKTGAMGSSLWEMETLMSHYHPNIATLAKIFGEPFRKPNYNLEDFLDWSYLTLLDSEKTRKYRGQASLEHEQWDTLFADGDKKAYVENWVL